MNSYLGLASKQLSMYRKKTRLVVLSVAISVALVTGIFSMMDTLLRFERIQIIHELGNYHLAVIDANHQEMRAIKNRIDVENYGRWKDLGEALIKGVTCRVGALDEAFAGNMNIEVLEGKYPSGKDEIMVEQWATENLYLAAGVGHKVIIEFENNTKRQYVISGIYNDLGNMKAAGVPGVILPAEDAEGIAAADKGFFLVEFKEGVKINKSVEDIKNTLGISDDRIGLNNHLLAVMGQSDHKAATGLYTIGAVLSGIVLIAGAVMIYNTFNISVMDRTRQFGLLRCIGASRLQIKRLLRREGLIITLRAIPLGILSGMMMAFACSTLLKFFNGTIFKDIPLFSVSIPGIAAGILIGFLTVFLALLMPARRAAAVSPVYAVAGSVDTKVSKRSRRGYLAKLLPVETAMGINNAVMKKKTLLLMSGSIAISIILLLGFNVLIDFMHVSLKTTKPYTPDISLVSGQGIDNQLYTELSRLEGVKKVYGRMLGYVDATFDSSRLTDWYKGDLGYITVKESGLFVPPEKSWLISYNEDQLNWSKEDLVAGTLDKDELNEKKGVIAVVQHLRNNITSYTADLQLGDKVYIDTSSGTKELTVLGILRSLPFGSEELTLTSFITTEELFTEITGQSVFRVVDIQLWSKKDEGTVDFIKGMMYGGITFHDMRQKYTEIDQLYLTMAVFVYGFVAVIALISLLNIINTMNTSVASKTRYLGMIRAVGMSGAQLGKMVLAEAVTYGLSGCFAGCVLGVMLQRMLILKYLTSFKVIWEFPTTQIIVIFIFAMLAAGISVIYPLRRIKSKGIPEVINTL